MEVDDTNILDDEEGADTLASLEYTNLESDGLLALTRQLQVPKRIISIYHSQKYFFFILNVCRKLIHYVTCVLIYWLHFSIHI